MLVFFCEVFTQCICAVSAAVLFAVLIARTHHTQSRAHVAACVMYVLM
ncbi:hypothetical protein HMPREF3232_01476 [Fannyhessea vaginae]|nr:hypothetical protein HMPREF3232_01476 [Fannyhessea vaginae]